MAFFQKRVKEKPQLPELPDFQNEPRLPELPPLPPLPSLTKMEPPGRTMPAPSQNSFIERRTFELPEASRLRPSNIPARTSMMNKEPIFIKLDKFKEAVEKFEEVKLKINDLDETLKKVKDIKDREEQELSAWESEIKNIKEKVSSIDNSLFGKI